MSVIKKGTDFGPNEQVTSTKLDDLVDNASFTDTSANAVAYTGSTGTCLNGGGLEVTSAGQLQIKDSDVSTAKLADDAVTQAKTSFIDHTTGAMTLSGTTPKVIFSDDDNTGIKPEVTGSSDNGNLAIITKESESDLVLQCSDVMVFETTDTPASDHNSSSNPFQERLILAHNAGKDENGNATAGAKVTGGLYVTGDVYADDQVVADHLLLQGSNPNIVFNDSDIGTPNAYITGNATGTEQKLLMYAPKASGDIATHSSDNFTVKVTNDGAADYDQTTNPYVERFRVAHDAGKDSSGTLSAGAKVSGDLQVTGDIHCSGDYNNITIKGSDPKLELSRTGVTTAPVVKGYANGSIEILTQQTDSDIILDANDDVILQYQNNTLFRAGDGQGRNASNTFVAGCKVEDSLQVVDDINVGGTIRTAALQIGANNILDLIHPIGSVIQTTTNYANSAAVVADYGGTTWTRFSEGRMLAGYKSTDSDFSAGNEDGSKTVTLTKAQLPTNITDTNTKISFGGNGVPSFSVSGDFSFGGSPATNHQPSFGSGGTNPSRVVNLDIGGSGDSHDNMPPYKVVYMWTRTA